MKTEARKSFRHGFLLSEQELRRVVDVLHQRVSQKTGNQAAVEVFKMKFRNGAISETRSIEEVLSLENIGTGALLRLEITVQEKQEEPRYFASVEFINAEGEEEGERPVRYRVQGEDRDWVFITSSELEERIGRVRTFSLPGGPPVFLFVGMAVFMLAFSFALLFFSWGMRSSRPVDKLESAWKSGAVKDPIEAIIMLEKEKRQSPAPGSLFPLLLGLPVGAVVVVEGVLYLFRYLFPPFTFYWGDYVSVYDRRRGIRKYVIVVVVTGIIVSIIGAVLAGRLGWVR